MNKDEQEQLLREVCAKVNAVLIQASAEHPSEDIVLLGRVMLLGPLDGLIAEIVSSKEHVRVANSIVDMIWYTNLLRRARYIE